MNKLIKLELKRTNIRTYLLAGIAITVCSLGMLYMFAVISRFETDNDFLSYAGILSITGLLNMIGFSVLGAVMYSRFVISEYAGKQAVILFSYPVDRKKIFYAKVTIVMLFVIAGFLISNLLISVFFLLTEFMFQIVNDTLTIRLIGNIIIETILMGLIAGGFSTIAMGIGFSRKSIPVTIVSAVILCAVFSNILSLSSITLLPTILATLFAVTISGAFASITAKKVAIMEV
ncbi:MAG: hypothetical protein LBS33_05210 [Streptococcaceae bacterium]|nr:hypothetical protein [Streptococcaceae bacterium]